MQITPDDLLAEAGRMALELRFKDQAIAKLEQEISQLRKERDEAPAKNGHPSEQSGGRPAGKSTTGC